MIFSLIRDILRYLDQDDRRAWMILFACSLIGGLSRSAFLALVNDAVAAYAQNRLTVFYYIAAGVLLVVMLSADFVMAVGGRFVADRLATKMRIRFSRKIGASNLRLVEQEGVPNLHYHLWISVQNIEVGYTLLLGFANALVTLICNTIYIGWLSPIALIITLGIMIIGVSFDWFYEKRNAKGRAIYEELRSRSSAAYMARLQGFKELRLSRAKTDDFHQRLEVEDEKRLDAAYGVAWMTASGLALTDLFLFSAIAFIGLGLPLLTNLSSILVMQLLAGLLFTIGPLGTAVAAFGNFGKIRVALDHIARLEKNIDDVEEPVAPVPSTLPEFQSVGLRDATFRFEGKGGVEDFVLGPVSMDIKKGEVVYIVGGNGSGKTVMARILAGLYQPLSGELLYNGRPLAREHLQDYREKFTSVFNDFHLFRELLAHVGDGEKVGSLLAYFGLEKKTHIDKDAFSTIELSTGQRKRLALIVSMLDDCPIVLLDEFAAEQDPRNRDLFYRVWLPELHRLGKTILIISHDQDYFHMADRLVRMDYGRIVAIEQLSDGQNVPAGLSA